MLNDLMYEGDMLISEYKELISCLPERFTFTSPADYTNLFICVDQYLDTLVRKEMSLLGKIYPCCENEVSIASVIMLRNSLLQYHSSAVAIVDELKNDYEGDKYGSC